MLMACGFWMMKITTAMTAPAPTICPVRRPRIQVDSGGPWGAGGAGGGRVEPLTDGGGRVLVVPCGAADSAMTLLPSGGGPAGFERGWFPLMTPGGPPRLRLF